MERSDCADNGVYNYALVSLKLMKMIIILGWKLEGNKEEKSM